MCFMRAVGGMLRVCFVFALLSGRFGHEQHRTLAERRPYVCKQRSKDKRDDEREQPRALPEGWLQVG